MHLQTSNILNVQVSAINMKSAIAQIHYWIEKKESAYVCVTPAHSIMECVQDPSLYPVFNGASMVTPDGMAVVWLMKLKGYKDVERVYGPDLLMSACEYGISHGWRHYFLGGTPEVLKDLTKQLQSKFTNLQIAGQYSPSFHSLSAAENDEIIMNINASQADIVWIGLGSPRQEIWMYENFGRVNASVMAGVGAAFDFLSGKKPQAPRWIQRIGMEWLFRLVSEPKRLWPRYRQYPRFVWFALRELLERK